MKAEEIQTDGVQGASLPVIFTFEKQEIRTIAKDGETWFVAADVCKVLGIQNTTQAVAPLDDDEKGLCLTVTLGGPQRPECRERIWPLPLNLRSDKAIARDFRRWITHDVLPTIRTTGRYEAKRPDQPQTEEIQVDPADRRIQVALPGGEGRFVITVLPNGRRYIYRSDFDRIEYEYDALNLRSLCYALKNIETFWYMVQHMQSIEFDPKGTIPMDTLETSILHGARTRDPPHPCFGYLSQGSRPREHKRPGVTCASTRK